MHLQDWIGRSETVDDVATVRHVLRRNRAQAAALTEHHNIVYRAAPDQGWLSMNDTATLA